MVQVFVIFGQGKPVVVHALLLIHIHEFLEIHRLDDLGRRSCFDSSGLACPSQHTRACASTNVHSGCGIIIVEAGQQVV